MLSRFRTIRGAMIFSYMAITLLALLIFLLFSLNYTERTILENSESYTIQLVEQVNGDIDSYISYMENIMEIVTNNPELSDYLFDRMEHIMMRERIQEQFVTLLDARSDICNIAVFAKNGRTLINRGTDTRNPYVDLASMPWYQDTMEAEGKAVISASHVQNAIEGKYQWVITLSKGLINPETHEVEGDLFCRPELQFHTGALYQCESGEQKLPVYRGEKRKDHLSSQAAAALQRHENGAHR